MTDQALPSITGRTTVVTIIGHPVRQVRSPTTLNAALRQRNIDAVLVPIDLLPAAVPDFLKMLRQWENTPGCIVTVPHKSACAGLVDTTSERARRLGAVNLIRRSAGGRLHGDMIDGEGFLQALRAHAFDIADKQAVIFGAGAVGRALLLSLAGAGASRLVYSDPDRSRLETLRRLAQEAGVADRLALGAPADLSPFDIAVNASPVGMGGTQMPFDPASLRPSALVADVVTDPAETLLLKAARARGCRVQNGLAMSDAQLEAQLAFLGLGSGSQPL
jgi:shikimate dehydrogenase